MNGYDQEKEIFPFRFFLLSFRCLRKLLLYARLQGSNIISGDNNVVTKIFRIATNKADSADIQAELKETMRFDGPVKAAENIGKVGEPVIDLSRKPLSLLTGGVVK